MKRKLDEISEDSPQRSRIEVRISPLKPDFFSKKPALTPPTALKQTQEQKAAYLPPPGMKETPIPVPSLRRSSTRNSISNVHVDIKSTQRSKGGQACNLCRKRKQKCTHTPDSTTTVPSPLCRTPNAELPAVPSSPVSTPSIVPLPVLRGSSMGFGFLPRNTLSRKDSNVDINFQATPPRWMTEKLARINNKIRDSRVSDGWINTPTKSTPTKSTTMFDTLRSLAKRGLKNGIAVGGVFDDPLEPDQEPVDVPVNAGENSDSGEQGGSGEQNNSGKKSDSGEKSDPGEMSILSQMSGSTEQDDPPKNTDEKDVPIDGQLEINVVASKWEKDLGKVRGTFGSDDVAIIENIAYSREYIANFPTGITISSVAIQATVLTLRLERDAPQSLSMLSEEVADVSICTVRAGKVRVTLAGNEFSIKRGGFWRVRGSEECVVQHGRRSAKEAVVFVVKISEQ